MPVLGLTGNLASGKSTVLELLNTKGAFVFDVDKRVHEYYHDKKSPIYKKVAGLFPESVVKEGIDWKVLAPIVFSDRHKLKMLEDIVHPPLIKDLRKWVAAAAGSKEVYVAEVPLLFEKDLAELFEKIIVVTVDEKVLIRRIMKKYNISRREALDRLGLFLPIKEKIKRADFVINNSSDFKNLNKEVELLWEKVK